MVRGADSPCKLPMSFPHACGDGPARGRYCGAADMFSPRMWGWSVVLFCAHSFQVVFPTHVGMVRKTCSVRLARLSFPHACGDGPWMANTLSTSPVFSPRMWGWSADGAGIAQNFRVFPTHVGMVRPDPLQHHPHRCFPHACGDGPQLRADNPEASEFSPRMWGWSGHRNAPLLRRNVFPTHVGMVRFHPPVLVLRRCFPHACGDGPNSGLPARHINQFSPRMWGWSVMTVYIEYANGVFPTHVGMVRATRLPGGLVRGFPHACGDGPHLCSNVSARNWFSPRMWGWSVRCTSYLRAPAVFPTHVGMVRTRCPSSVCAWRFPHACGDGPCPPSLIRHSIRFSPRMWGWSGWTGCPPSLIRVFPTHVGMVR